MKGESEYKERELNYDEPGSPRGGLRIVRAFGSLVTDGPDQLKQTFKDRAWLSRRTEKHLAAGLCDVEAREKAGVEFFLWVMDQEFDEVMFEATGRRAQPKKE